MNVEEVSSVAVDMAFHHHRDLGPGDYSNRSMKMSLRVFAGRNVKCLLPLTSMVCISTRDFASSRESESRRHAKARRVVTCR